MTTTDFFDYETCPNCGKVLDENSESMMFCSEQCQIGYWRELYPPPFDGGLGLPRGWRRS